MIREIRFPSVKPLKGPPIIKKSGIISPSGGEMSVFVWKGKLMHLQTHSPGFVVTPYEVNDFSRVYGRKGPYYYQAFCEGDRVYVFATEKSHVFRWVSDDLTHWEESHVLDFPENFYLYNTAVCRDEQGYVMAIEAHAAEDEAHPGERVPNPHIGRYFTEFFARSSDLAKWELFPFDTAYTKERYNACPALKYSCGYYYMICLEELPITRYAPYIYRTADFETWEIGYYNPLFIASWEDRCVKPGVLLTETEMNFNLTHPNTNNSDVDLCEYNGKTYIVYCTGDQGNSWGGMYCEAIYDGGLDEFLRANFE